MRQRLLAMLLHYANADPPWMRTEFYALKQRLLLKYAEFRGHDLQEIRKDCWGPGTWDDKWGDYDYAGCPGKGCPRCGGDGIFSIKWIRLDRWQRKRSCSPVRTCPSC